jgi:hypothetical protein
MALSDQEPGLNHHLALNHHDPGLNHWQPPQTYWWD